jgi:lipopolysaccharide export system permease protein
MIVRRYILREVTLNFLGVALLLSVMFLSSTFIRLLGETLEGDYPAKILFTLFALKGVGNLVFILPLSFFLAVMLAFGRLYRDSEMVVLSACGVRPGEFLKSVGILGFVLALAVGAMSLFFAPWAESQSELLLDKASTRTGIEGLIPGQFNLIGDDGPVIYVEKYNPNTKRLTDVFVSFTSGDKRYQLTSHKGYEQKDKKTGERYLVLLDGYRYEGVPGQANYRVMKFKEHGVRIQERAPILSTRHRYAYPTTRLLASTEPDDKAELQWRLAMPLSTLLLGLLAVPLSKTSPRRGRFGGLMLGIMIYLVYNNLLTVAKSSMAKGEVNEYIGMWWVHLLLLAILMLLHWRQNSPGGVLRLRRVSA